MWCFLSFKLDHIVIVLSERIRPQDGLLLSAVLPLPFYARFIQCMASFLILTAENCATYPLLQGSSHLQSWFHGWGTLLSKKAKVTKQLGLNIRTHTHPPVNMNIYNLSVTSDICTFAKLPQLYIYNFRNHIDISIQKASHKCSPVINLSPLSHSHVHNPLPNSKHMGVCTHADKHTFYKALFL